MQSIPVLEDCSQGIQKDNLVIDVDCDNVDNYEFIEYVPIKKVKKI